MKVKRTNKNDQTNENWFSNPNQNEISQINGKKPPKRKTSERIENDEIIPLKGWRCSLTPLSRLLTSSVRGSRGPSPCFTWMCFLFLFLFLVFSFYCLHLHVCCALWYSIHSLVSSTNPPIRLIGFCWPYFFFPARIDWIAQPLRSLWLLDILIDRRVCVVIPLLTPWATTYLLSLCHPESPSHPIRDPP